MDFLKNTAALALSSLLGRHSPANVAATPPPILNGPLLSFGASPRGMNEPRNIGQFGRPRGMRAAKAAAKRGGWSGGRKAGWQPRIEEVLV